MRHSNSRGPSDTGGITRFGMARQMAMPLYFLAIGICMIAGIVGCYRNPATGKEQLSFVSESQEIEMGRQADQQIVAQLGLYPDSSWQRYIQMLGSKLAASSERPDLPWTFRVVDDPVVNAFALPGGFIYVTRGLLYHVQNEAQLAGVVGHEIGHVTAKHSVNQMSKQQLAQVGLIAGMMIKPELQKYGQLASTGLGLLFLKFGRDDEKEADDLGLRYMYRVGNDPRQMVGVFTMLTNVSKASGGGRLPEWLSTHPDPENRAERIKKGIDTIKADFAGTHVGRDEYLNRLEGMIYGVDPREGYFENTTFFQPTLKFQITFPQGWQTSNQKQAVMAGSPSQDAIIGLSLSNAPSAEKAAQTFLSQEGIRPGPAETGKINDLSSTIAEFGANTEQGMLYGAACWINYDGKVYEILAYAPETAWPNYHRTAIEVFQTFDRLTDPSRLKVEPAKIDVVTIVTPMSAQQFLSRLVSTSVKPEAVALINQFQGNESLSANQRVKTIVGGTPATVGSNID